MRPLAACLCLAAAGCPKAPPPDSCTLAFAGDPDAGIEALPVLDVAVDGGVQLVAVSDGDQIGIVPPPQGGFVFFAAARVKNLDPCNVAFSGQLFDPATGNVASGVSKRTGDIEPDGTGYFVPKDLASFSHVANVPACPDALGVGVLGRTLELRIIVTDREGRSATVKRQVGVFCPPGPCLDLCSCTCGADYFPGKCGADGGTMGDAGPSCVRP
jgi:hypothetical protein